MHIASLRDSFFFVVIYCCYVWCFLLRQCFLLGSQYSTNSRIGLPASSPRQQIFRRPHVYQTLVAPMEVSCLSSNWADASLSWFVLSCTYDTIARSNIQGFRPVVYSLFCATKLVHHKGPFCSVFSTLKCLYTLLTFRVNFSVLVPVCLWACGMCTRWVYWGLFILARADVFPTHKTFVAVSNLFSLYSISFSQRLCLPAFPFWISWGIFDKTGTRDYRR